MTVISTFFKEEGELRVRADVVLENDCYVMKVYDNEGRFVVEKPFPGKSVTYAESAAENWALGYQVLND